MPKKPPKPEPGDRDEPVSMEGLDPVEALRALLAVDPDDNNAASSRVFSPHNGGPPASFSSRSLSNRAHPSWSGPGISAATADNRSSGHKPSSTQRLT